MISENNIAYLNGHTDWITLVLLLCCFLIWSVWRNAGGFLEQKSFEVLHGHERKSLFSGDTVSELRIGSVLGVVHVLVVSLFLYHLINYFEFESGYNVYMLISLIVVLFHLVKLGCVYYWNYLINTKDRYRLWLKSYNVFNLVLGLLLLPVVIFITFMHGKPIEIGLNIGLFFIAIYLVALLLRSIKIFFSNFGSFIYVILYFCTLEILPLLIIVKMVR